MINVLIKFNIADYVNILGAMISGGGSYFVVFFMNYKKIKAETDVKITNIFFALMIQECFVCMFAFLTNWLFSLAFGTKIALFVGGVVSVIIFAVTYYVLFLIDKPKKISS